MLKQVFFALIFIVFSLAVIISVILLAKIFILITKRLIFALKFKLFCKKHGVRYTLESVLRSLFKASEKPYITVEINGKEAEVFIFSSIFRHSRYHFLDNGKVEIYHVGRGVIPFLGRAHLRTFAAHPEGITRLSETKLMTVKGFLPEKSEKERIILVHPAPLYVTRVLGNGPRTVYDGEMLIGDMMLCSGSGLRKYLLRSDTKDKTRNNA